MRTALNVSANMSPQASGGLAGWLLDRLRLPFRLRVGEQREMRLVETLALGGKRQLMLVQCGGERYLVGGGADSVHTIVQVAGQAAADTQGECL